MIQRLQPRVVRQARSGAKVRYTREVMARRLCALVLVLVAVLAPVATVVCQVRCQSHGTDATSGHVHHHSCPPLPSVSGISVAALPHTCGHPTDQTVAVQQSFQLLTAPALVAAQPFSFAPPLDVTMVTRRTHIEQSPPGLPALPAQLRI